MHGVKPTSCTGPFLLLAVGCVVDTLFLVTVIGAYFGSEGNPLAVKTLAGAGVRRAGGSSSTSPIGPEQQREEARGGGGCM